jgi:simple sugar transport system permease protein
MDVLLFVAATFRISVPYALAAVGASFSERGGVVNIALEGIMLNSALAYVLGAYASGNPAVGLGAALLAGLATAGLHAWITVGLRGEQITSGIGINLLSAGLTRYVLVSVFGSSSNSPRVVGFDPLVSFDTLPGLGSVLTSPLVLVGLVLIPAAQWLMFGSVFGLRLRSVGERPEAVAALGLPVVGYRVTGVLISGLFGGLAGAWLASEQHSFTDGMTNGRGYVAIAAMIVGRWSPFGAALACLVFGAAEALQIALQGSGFPSELIQVLPYVVTMLAVSGFLGRSFPPRALGTPFAPERSGQ